MEGKGQDEVDMESRKSTRRKAGGGVGRGEGYLRHAASIRGQLDSLDKGLPTFAGFISIYYM